MVSIDHFRQQLLVQLRYAATEGRIDILINSGELLSHHSGELFLVRFLLRCHARGAQVRRYAGS
jgi:hypothetical protein